MLIFNTYNTLNLEEKIYSSKNNKSTGTDQICAEILKASFDIVSPVFIQRTSDSFLFNLPKF